MSAHPQAGAKGLGRFGLGQRQDSDSARVWPAAGEALGPSGGQVQALVEAG